MLARLLQRDATPGDPTACMRTRAAAAGPWAPRPALAQSALASWRLGLMRGSSLMVSGVSTKGRCAPVFRKICVSEFLCYERNSILLLVMRNCTHATAVSRAYKFSTKMIMVRKIENSENI